MSCQSVLQLETRLKAINWMCHDCVGVRNTICAKIRTQQETIHPFLLPNGGDLNPPLKIYAVRNGIFLQLPLYLMVIFSPEPFFFLLHLHFRSDHPQPDLMPPPTLALIKVILHRCFYRNSEDFCLGKSDDCKQRKQSLFLSHTRQTM